MEDKGATDHRNLDSTEISDHESKVCEGGWTGSNFIGGEASIRAAQTRNVERVSVPQFLVKYIDEIIDIFEKLTSSYLQDQLLENSSR